MKKFIALILATVTLTLTQQCTAAITQDQAVIEAVQREQKARRAFRKNPKHAKKIIYLLIASGALTATAISGVYAYRTYQEKTPATTTWNTLKKIIESDITAVKKGVNTSLDYTKKHYILVPASISGIIAASVATYDLIQGDESYLKSLANSIYESCFSKADEKNEEEIEALVEEVLTQDAFPMEEVAEEATLITQDA